LLILKLFEEVSTWRLFTWLGC